MKTKVTIQHTYIVKHESKAGLRDAIADLKKSPSFECFCVGEDGYEYRRLARSAKLIRDGEDS